MGNRNNERFSEDLEEKARWFFGIRGKQTSAELNKRWHRALAQIDVLRSSKTLNLDPGGDALKSAYRLTGGARGKKSVVVDNPYPKGASHFASACVQVDLDVEGARPSMLRLRPLRGASARLSIGTAMVFRWDCKIRRWQLVDHSGYSTASRSIWALITRSGVYAAVALPRDARPLALERFAYYYAELGAASGITARASEYFDAASFRQLVAIDPGLTDRATKKLQSGLMSVHRETRSIRKRWRGQLPNGGLAEWHLIEHLAANQSEWIDRLGLADIVDRFPWIFHLANRVGRWIPNGPWNINGRVKSLAIHPTDGKILYAGAADGGIWKSFDAGATWTHRWTFQDSMAVGSVAIAPSSPSVLYAATGEDTPGYGPSYGGVGLYKSVNNGTSWTNIVGAWALGAHCSKVVVHPGNASIVYVASETGVHKSTDGGATFARMRSGHASDLVIARDHPDTLYAGFWNDGLYKTVDGGAHWTRIETDVKVFIIIGILTSPFPTGTDAGWIKLAIGRDGPHGSDYVVAKLGDKGSKTYATYDGGASWNALWGSEAVDYDEWTSMIAIHPANPKRMLLGGLNLQYSDDGFGFQPTNGTHSDHHQVVFDPRHEMICYCCCDGGVFRSDDGGVNWTLRSRYLQATQLMSLGVAQQGNFIAGSATQDQGIIQTTGGNDWDDHGGGNEWGMFVVDPNDSHHVYVSPGDSAQLRRSTDGGITWSNPTQGLTDPWPSQGRQTQPAAFAHVAVRPGISNFLIAGATVAEQIKDDSGTVTDSYGPIYRLYYSRDWGQSWWNAHTLPSRPSRVAYAPSNDHRAYAATVDGRFYRSDHGGEPGWYQPASVANRPPAGVVTCITVDPSDADIVYITYGDVSPHVWRTTDGGQHWTSAAGVRPDMSLPDIAASALVVDHESGDILYVATDIGVFRSNDWGASWYPYNDAPGGDDLPKVVVTGLAQHNATNRLFASTMGRGLYYTYTSGILSLRVLAVSYNFHGRRESGIQYLRLTDGSTTYVMTRLDVIRRIEAGTNVYTIGADGSRAEVLVMEPDAEHPIQYLKTATDYILADNLMSLPRF